MIPDGAQVVADPSYNPLEAQRIVTVDLHTELGSARVQYRKSSW